MRKIFIALCTMVSVITGNAQNTPIGENIELAGENPEELKVNITSTKMFQRIYSYEDINMLIYQSMILLAIFLLVTLLE